MFNPLNKGDADIAAAYGLKAHGGGNPTWAQAMKGDEANQRRDEAQAKMQNFERHGVYIEISEDQLPSWKNHSKRATEVIDMMWVLRKKKGEKGDLLKYKARAASAGINRSARAARICIRSHSRNLRTSCALRHLQKAAYLQGKFEGYDGEVFVRPPPDERFFDDRGVPVAWELLKPLYGEADAGRIWHRTAEKQLVETQGFTQS
eukprot:5191913-Pleurochrysis_carterae.AAC.2